MRRWSPESPSVWSHSARKKQLPSAGLVGGWAGDGLLNFKQGQPLLGPALPPPLTCHLLDTQAQARQLSSKVIAAIGECIFALVLAAVGLWPRRQ